MPYSNQKEGTYTHAQAFDAVKIADIPGPNGIWTAITIFWFAEDLPVLGPDYGMLMYPNGPGASGPGPTVSGNRSFVPDATTPTTWIPGIDTTLYDNNISSVSVRIDIDTVEGTRRFIIAFNALDSTDPGDFPSSDPGNKPPTPKGTNDVVADPPTVTPNPPLSDGKVLIEWKSGAVDVDDEDGFVIERSLDGGIYPWDIAGSVPKNPATFPDYSFEDNLEENGFDRGPGDYIYRIRGWKLATSDGNALSDPTLPTDTIVFGGGDTGNVVMVGNLTLDMDWISTMVFTTDISGVYTLVPGQVFDRVYNRGGGDDYIDMKIPNPFVKIGPFK